MNSKNYESWKLEGMPYCYGQSFEIEYNDLDSWVKTSIDSHTDHGLKVNIRYLGKTRHLNHLNEIIDVKHDIEEEIPGDSDPYVETLSLHFKNEDSHDYFIRLIRELYRRFC